MHHRYKRHQAENFSTRFASVVDTSGKFATGVNDASGKLPPVSMTPAANSRRCRWHRWQTMGAIIKLLTTSNELEKKIYLYANSTSQRCPKEIIKHFLIEDFFLLPPVSLTPVANLELQISPRIFKKLLNGPNGIFRGLGELIHEKNQTQKISWHCPFKDEIVGNGFYLPEVKAVFKIKNFV